MTKAEKKAEAVKVTVSGKTYTMLDMRNWYVQIRTFRSILSFGSGANNVQGEGQSGGRAVADIAQAAEIAFVEKLGGTQEYSDMLDTIMPGGVKENYKDGECPDCGRPISVRAKAGDECPNCGHVYA